MATLVLGAAGSYVGGPVGQFIGAAIGAVIDQMFLFPPPEQKGPRLDSLLLSSASEGTPMSFFLGQACRAPGEYIFASRLREREVEQGKGGGGVSSYTYSCDTAVAFGEGPINRIVKLWANGRLIYDDDPDIEIFSDELSVRKVTIYIWIGGYESTYVEEIYEDIVADGLGPDMTRFQTGVDIVISGWSTTGNNGTFKVDSTFRDESTGETIVRVKNPLATNDAGGEDVTLFQDLPKFSPDDMQSITFYLGTDSQLPNSLIESHEGVGNVPGYRFVAYCVIEGFELKSYGNVLPNALQALIEQSPGVMTLAEGISKICARSKLSSSSFDVSGVTGDLLGYTIRGPQPIANQLAPLLLAYDILTQEDNGVLRFFNRANAEVVELDEKELVAHADGEDPPRPLETTNRRGQRVPKLLVVNYLDPELDYLNGSQSDSRNQALDNYTLTLDLTNLVLTSIQAKTIARRVIWTAVANAKHQRLQVGPNRVDVLENDIISFQTGGLNYRILLTQVDQGQNGICLLEGGNEHASTLEYDNLVTDPPAEVEGGLTTPPEITFRILDLAPLRDEELNLPGYYFAACASSYAVAFLGASLFVSDDGGANYTNVLFVAVESTIGYTTTTLGDASYGYVDNKNTVDVILTNGSLESTTELSMFAGRNWALCGREIICFQNATLIASRTYRLSVFCRGLRSTEDAMSTHITGESFVLLTVNSLNARTIPASRINAPQAFKCISPGQLLADVPATTYAVKANNLRPFAPCAIKGSRDGSNNLTITWVRRTRAPVRLLGGTGIPLSEESELYEVEILNAAETVVLATHSILATRSLTLSDAVLTAPPYSFASGAAVHLRIYQRSAIVGRSKSKLAVV